MSAWLEPPFATPAVSPAGSTAEALTEAQVCGTVTVPAMTVCYAPLAASQTGSPLSRLVRWEPLAGVSYWLTASISFLSDDELLIGKLSETVVVIGDAPHNRPRFLVDHLVRYGSGLFCTAGGYRCTAPKWGMVSAADRGVAFSERTAKGTCRSPAN